MTPTAPAVPPPSHRLEAIPPERRAAVLAIVATRAAPSEAALAWVEKVRRFASLHRGRLRRVASRRFGKDARFHLSWMTRLLLEGALRHPARGAAPFDGACLGAALYCLDALPRADPDHAALLEGCPASVGLTAHYMAAQIDAGDVLTRATRDPGRYSTAGALGNALAGLLPLLLLDAALGSSSGRLHWVRQRGGGRQHYPLHPRLRPIVDECLAGRASRLRPDGPSPVRRTLDAVCADLIG